MPLSSASTVRTRRHRQNRASSETTIEREVRLSNKRLRMARLRSQEGPAQIERRQSYARERYRTRRTLRHDSESLCAAYHYDENSITEVGIGKMEFTCSSCGAMHFSGERTGADDFLFTSCCQKGKITLGQSKISQEDARYMQKMEALQFLKALMTGEHPSSVHFMDLIRSYNGSLAFASINSNIHMFNSPGPYVYRVHGQIYHCLSSVSPSVGQLPQFNQLYFLSTDEVVSHRQESSIRHSLNIGLLGQLENWKIPSDF